MPSDRSTTSQGWVMYHLGVLQGQHEQLLKKASAVLNLHEKVRKGELDPRTLDTLAGLDDLLKATKEFQACASMLMACCFMWRADWSHEHGEAPHLKKEPL